MPKRSSTKLTSRKVATESRIPLVRRGVSSRRLEGFSPGRNSERIYWRISSFILSIIDPFGGIAVSIPGPESIRGQAVEKVVPDVLGTIFHLGNHAAHFIEHGRLSVIVHIALQEFQDIQAIAPVGNEIGEQHVEPIIDADEVVPVLGAPADGLFKLPETGAGKVVLLQRPQDVPLGEAGAVQGDADTRGKNRIDETAGIAHQYETVAANPAHGVAVVAFF